MTVDASGVPMFQYLTFPVEFRRRSHRDNPSFATADELRLNEGSPMPYEPGNVVIAWDGASQRSAIFMHVLSAYGFSGMYPSIVLERDIEDMRLTAQRVPASPMHERFIENFRRQPRFSGVETDRVLPYIEGYMLARIPDRACGEQIELLSVAKVDNNDALIMHVRPSNPYNAHIHTLLKLPPLPKEPEVPKTPVLQEYGEEPKAPSYKANTDSDRTGAKVAETPNLTQLSMTMSAAVRDGVQAAIMDIVEKSLQKILPAMLMADPALDDTDRTDLKADLERLYNAYKTAVTGEKSNG